MSDVDIAACDNCGSVTEADDLVPLDEVPDLGERLEPGSVVPAGECRECGALAYLTDTTAVTP